MDVKVYSASPLHQGNGCLEAASHTTQVRGEGLHPVISYHFLPLYVCLCPGGMKHLEDGTCACPDGKEYTSRFYEIILRLDNGTCSVSPFGSCGKAFGSVHSGPLS